jgi:Ricin-type beta-trefoil lectin domain-like
MQTSPGSAERYLALWLDMTSPGSAKTGYQLQWTATSTADTYGVTLRKWTSGSSQVLASNSSVSIPTGTTIAVSDIGGYVTAWKGTGGTLTSFLSASDSTLSSGYAGIEGSGSSSRSINFKAGILAAGAITGVSVLDNLERNEAPLATGKWSKSSWAGEIGGASMTGRHGYSAGAGLASAYWNPTTFADSGETVLVGGTVGSGAVAVGQYLGLWLDMPSPASARSGYEARFTGNSSNYKVELSKWVSGTRTVLATTSGFSLSPGTNVALTETTGGKLRLWTGTSVMSNLLSATDTTYASGYAGLEVSGGEGSIYNFRAGRVAQPPDTTISAGPTGTIFAPKTLFAFTSSKTGSTFECSLDGATYAACTSPTTTDTLTIGSHMFRVRALDARGIQDETPAERAFQAAAAPSPVTTAATGAKSTQATLHANVNPNGAETTYQFEYGTTTSYGTKAPTAPKSIGAGTQAVEVSEEISGLQAGTTYHYRVSATNGGGVRNGEDQTFVTVVAPTATTEPASAVKANEATLNAIVNPKGGATTYQFEYGPTTSYGSKIPVAAKSAGSGTNGVSVSEVLGGLTQGSTYHYRVVAQNEVGTAYGADQTITTPLLPTVTTEAATGVTANEATLNATINPNGMSTTYELQYGTTTSYGSAGPATEAEAGSGVIGVKVLAAPEGLSPETTYHYRVVATSKAGTVFGADKTLTTATSSVSAQQEEEEAEEEDNFTGNFLDGPLPNDFVNMMWSGNPSIETRPEEMEVIRQSGAKMLRHSVLLNPEWEQKCNKNGCWHFYDDLFRTAANKGITILPDLGGNANGASGFPTTNFQNEEWEKFVKQANNRYGPGGTFWSEYAGVDQPVHYWEVGNENNYGGWDPGGIVNPNQFGEYLSRTNVALEQAAGGNVNVILGGLLSVGGRKGGQTNPTQLKVGEFLTQMTKGRNAFTALGLHPYAFKANNGGAPSNSTQVEQVRDKVRENIIEAREALGSGKQIWITELGWPVKDGHEEAGDTGHPRVSEQVQRELIKSTFEMTMAKSETEGVRNVFYYNDIDLDGNNNWAYNSGLRAANGHFRPSWYGFEHESKHAENYPRKPGRHTGGHGRHKKRQTLMGTVNAEGLSTQAYFQYGSTTAYGSSTAPQSAGYEEKDVEVSGETGTLIAKHTYHYRVVATNANEETSFGEDQEFTTPASTETSAGVVQTLNGESGWVRVGGWVHEGNEGLGLPHYGVNVKFYRETPPGSKIYVIDKDRTTQVETDGEGHYETGYVPIGKGSWMTEAVFFAQGEYNESADESKSGEHTFTIQNGYQLVAKHSGKCLDVAEESTANSAWVHQWECLNPATQQNQVFTLVPEGIATYRIVARHSNRCVSVTGADATNGTHLEQYDCGGPGTPGQTWIGAPVEGVPDYSHFIAQFDGKCMDVAGQETWNGDPVIQWDCLGTQANQLWTLRSVESNDIVTHTELGLGETLNGQPGFQSVSGNVNLGAYSTAGKYVNINFEKKEGGQWVYKDTAHANLDGGGNFEYPYWKVGVGDWRVRAVLEGDGALAESKSPYREFHIGSGYHLVVRHSDKCMSLSGNNGANGTAIIQWECSPNPNPNDGQVFTFVPMTPGYFEILINSTSTPTNGKCVDVTGGSTENGANLQEYECIGPGQANQLWHVQPIQGQDPWNAFIAKHSGKCADVEQVSTANGMRVHQWECLWAGNQQWKFVPID